MYKGAVFFDYDGTLSDEREGIYFPTEKTCAAIKKLRANGYLAILASGRSRCYAPESVIEFDGMITANGAYTFVGDNIISEVCFGTDLLADIINYCDEHDINYAFECCECSYAKNVREKHFKEVIDNFNIPESIFVPLDGIPEAGINKAFVTYADHSDGAGLDAALGGRISVYPHRFCMSADVNLSGVTKATGVEAIVNYFGIDINNTYAFGDGTNDYDMLAAVGHGIAMKAHAECLDEVAEKIAPSVAEEGVSRTLEAYGLV